MGCDNSKEEDSSSKKEKSTTNNKEKSNRSKKDDNTKNNNSSNDDNNNNSKTTNNNNNNTLSRRKYEPSQQESLTRLKKGQRERGEGDGVSGGRSSSDYNTNNETKSETVSYSEVESAHSVDQLHEHMRGRMVRRKSFGHTAKEPSQKEYDQRVKMHILKVQMEAMEMQDAMGVAMLNNATASASSPTTSTNSRKNNNRSKSSGGSSKSPAQKQPQRRPPDNSPLVGGDDGTEGMDTEDDEDLQTEGDNASSIGEVAVAEEDMPINQRDPSKIIVLSGAEAKDYRRTRRLNIYFEGVEACLGTGGGGQRRSVCSMNGSHTGLLSATANNNTTTTSHGSFDPLASSFNVDNYLDPLCACYCECRSRNHMSEKNSSLSSLPPLAGEDEDSTGGGSGGSGRQQQQLPGAVPSDGATPSTEAGAFSPVSDVHHGTVHSGQQQQQQSSFAKRSGFLHKPPCEKHGCASAL